MFNKYHKLTNKHLARLSELTSKEIAFYNHYIGREAFINSTNTSLMVEKRHT